VVGAGRHDKAGQDRLGSGMPGRQARASTMIMRLSKPHDLGSSCLLQAVGRHRTHRTYRENAGALPTPGRFQVLGCSKILRDARTETHNARLTAGLTLMQAPLIFNGLIQLARK
jgi:hypothetical protein